MKKNLIIICFLFFSVSIFSKKVINRPFFSNSTHGYVSIEQVEINDTATILRMKVNMKPSHWWRISPDTYIQPSNHPDRLNITHAEGITLGENMYTKNGTSTFTLFFPPIDMNTQQLNFVESDCSDCFKIYDVDLTGNGIENLYDNEEYAAVRQPESQRKQVPNTEKSKSSVTYNGSAYNVLFSWKKKANDPHWASIGMAFADFDGMTDTNGELRTSTSYSFILNPIEYSIPLDHHWLLVSGLGIDWTRYHFKGNIGLEEVNGITQFVPAPAGTTYKSSKLLTYYLTVPLLLEYQTKIAKERSIFFSGGFVGYIRCYSKSQVDMNVEGGIQKINKGRDLNILPVNGRFMLQAGISKVNFFGYYSPFSLFEKDKGPDIKPVGIGVMLDF